MRLLLASATGLLLGALLCLLLFNPAMPMYSASWVLPGAVTLALCIVVVLGSAIGSFVGALLHPGPWIERSAAVLWMGLLPLLGFAYDALVDPCTQPCTDTYQPVAWPGAWLLLASYGLSLLAWGAHWRRPRPLPWHQEAAVVGGMGQGVVACVLTAVQFGPALAFAPLFPPLLSPTISSLVLTWAVLARLRTAGLAAGASGGTVAAIGFGLWSLLGAAWTGTFHPYGGAFSQTCNWTMSQLTPPVGDCHYLCTVAAQGHPWLVRPRRMGMRRGRPIVVNRQLAVANAFEDLLHERWPRLGRLARQVYDALARDISRWLLLRWVASLVYLAMLPAQGVFELTLLLLDPGDPEERIDRMYRPRDPRP